MELLESCIGCFLLRGCSQLCVQACVHVGTGLSQLCIGCFLLRGCSQLCVQACVHVGTGLSQSCIGCFLLRGWPQLCVPCIPKTIGCSVGEYGGIALPLAD